MFEFVDDADVRRPSDNERYVEVDDAGSKNIGFVTAVVWAAADCSRPPYTNIPPDERRDIERHVVDPDADENSRSYARFESTSTYLVYSQESTEQLLYLNLADCVNASTAVLFFLDTESKRVRNLASDNL